MRVPPGAQQGAKQGRGQAQRQDQGQGQGKSHQGHKGKAKAARQQSPPTPAPHTNTGETTPCPSYTKQPVLNVSHHFTIPHIYYMLKKTFIFIV